MPTRSLSPNWEVQQRLRPTLVGTVLAVHAVMFLGLSQLRTPPAPAKTPPMTASPLQPEPPKPIEEIKPTPVTISKTPVTRHESAPVPAHAPRTEVPTEGPAATVDMGHDQPAPALPTPPAKETGPVAPAQPQHIGLVCPQQVAPEMPGKAQREGLEGVVRATAVVVQGRVTQVRIVSGPKVFHQAVIDAMRQYQCTVSATPVEATQDFGFSLKD